MSCRAGRAGPERTPDGERQVPVGIRPAARAPCAPPTTRRPRPRPRVRTPRRPAPPGRCAPRPGAPCGGAAPLRLPWRRPRSADPGAAAAGVRGTRVRPGDGSARGADEPQRRHRRVSVLAPVTPSPASTSRACGRSRRRTACPAGSRPCPAAARSRRPAARRVPPPHPPARHRPPPRRTRRVPPRRVPPRHLPPHRVRPDRVPPRHLPPPVRLLRPSCRRTHPPLPKPARHVGQVAPRCHMHPAGPPTRLGGDPGAQQLREAVDRGRDPCVLPSARVAGEVRSVSNPCRADADTESTALSSCPHRRGGRSDPLATGSLIDGRGSSELVGPLAVGLVDGAARQRARGMAVPKPVPGRSFGPRGSAHPRGGHSPRGGGPVTPVSYGHQDRRNGHPSPRESRPPRPRAIATTRSTTSVPTPAAGSTPPERPARHGSRATGRRASTRRRRAGGRRRD